MLKNTLSLSFKDSPAGKDLKINIDNKSKLDDDNNLPIGENKNCWSGYHVMFRNPKNYQEFVIDEQFNRWGDMVEFFQNQERPYKLSQGSLKDLLYGTYKRKGMHGLSLNDLVTIEKIEREKITKVKSKDELDQDLDDSEAKPKSKRGRKAKLVVC